MALTDQLIHERQLSFLIPISYFSNEWALMF